MPQPAESAFASGLFSNPFILLGIAIELTLIAIIDYTSWGNALFATAPIPLSVWLFVVPFALGMLSLEEMRKWLVRGGEKKRHAHLAPIGAHKSIAAP